MVFSLQIQRRRVTLAPVGIASARGRLVIEEEPCRSRTRGASLLSGALHNDASNDGRDRETCAPTGATAHGMRNTRA